MNKQEIIFVLPLSRFAFPSFSLGVLSVCSYLRKMGFESTILEPHKLFSHNYKFTTLNEKEYEKLKENFVEYVKEVKPKIIGFSCLTYEFNEVIRMIESIRKISDAKIIVGGCHANIRPLDFFMYKKDLVDFVVYGEGEITLFELVKAIDEEMKDFDNIDGLVWRKGKEIIQNKRRAFMENLDELPVPAFDLIDMKRYIGLNCSVRTGMPLHSFSMTTSRGCPYNCSYCNHPVLFGRKVRFRSEKNMEDEIKVLKENYNIEGIWFTDSTFSINENHVEKICRIMRKYNLLWCCDTRVDRVNDAMLKIMKDSGCVQITFGIESGSQRILNDIIKKGITLEQIKKAIALCKKHKIATRINVIMGSPTETREELQQTIDLALKLNGDYYLTYMTIPYPGTEIYKMVGVDVKPEEYYKLDYTERVSHTQFNKSKIENLDSLYISFKNKLKRKAKINFIVGLPSYIKFWMSLPDKRKRLAYQIKNAYNQFIYKPIFKRSLRIWG